LIWKPNLIITIDSPDFSFRIAKKIKSQWPEAKTVHYVAPSVWAWRAYRAKKMGGFIDHVLAILPFEPPYMVAAGMSCDFVGHPIVVEAIPSNQEIRLFRSSLGIERQVPIVSVLPGSRLGEVSRMMPLYLKSIRAIKKQFPNLIFIVASPQNVTELVKQFLKESDIPIIQLYEEDPLKFEEKKRMLFSTSLAAVATSGTVTLEIARMGAPLLVGYRASLITEFMFKNFVKLKSATLINILTNQNSIPELLFSRCSDYNISSALISLLTHSDQVDLQRRSVTQAMIALGANDLDPKIRAAQSVLKFLKNH
jgi:lipid-A-disaccharide synthase